jgi:DNA-binding transcriptional MerR regulator
VPEPTLQTPRRPLLKSAEVCDIVKVQPYVLRSWEKEFPDLGVSRTDGGPRLYRQADVERALRIKQLVFSEGLTLAGARRKLDEERAAATSELPFEEDESPAPAAVVPATRERIEEIKHGLRSLLDLLGSPRSGQQSAPPPAEPEAALEPVAVAAPRKASRRRTTSTAPAE